MNEGQTVIIRALHIGTSRSTLIFGVEIAVYAPHKKLPKLPPYVQSPKSLSSIKNHACQGQTIIHQARKITPVTVRMHLQLGTMTSITSSWYVAVNYIGR